MKTKIYLLLLTILTLAIVPNTAQANDYLEIEDHYRVIKTGPNVIHFKIPVWSYGKSFDYYIGSPSNFYIDEVKNSSGTTMLSKTIIGYFDSDRYDENENKNNTKGTAYLAINAGMGDAIVKSMHNGVDMIVSAGTSSGKMIVKQTEESDNPQVTWLEFDWYPPQSISGVSLDKLTFRIGLKLYVKKSYTGNTNYEFDFHNFGSSFSSSDNMLDPQLYTPYLYTLNDAGKAGYGYAAVPFITFQETDHYKTSLEPNKTWPNTERSGNIFVMTTDTIQKHFAATFHLQRNDATKTWTDMTTSKVDILPYHRIHNFQAVQEMDSTGTFTGLNILQWTIKNPTIKDLLDGDFFEVQRAFEKDFSDAKQIGIVQMTRGAMPEKLYDGDSITRIEAPATQTYTFTDDSRDTWTGNADAGEFNVSHFSYSGKDIYVYNHGYPLFKVDAKISANNLTIPCVPVYYRIRRASSSVWGWEHEFAQNVELLKRNFLAPLDEEQAPYTPDADFENNRKVHFNFHLVNQEVSIDTPEKSDFNITFSNSRMLSNIVTAYVNFTYRSTSYGMNPYSHVQVTFEDNDGNVLIPSTTVDEPSYFNIPRGSRMIINYEGYGGHKSHTFMIAEDSRVDFRLWEMEKYGYIFITDVYCDYLHYASRYKNENVDDYITSAFKERVKDSLYQFVAGEVERLAYGRCMWDKTALLVLRRTIVETNQTQEFIIPQDSIKRLPDGSWVAHYTDVADQPCVHYSYEVRIDQSRSDLHVQDSTQLAPKAISGPNLYFDEAATITRFEATQGDASTMMKNGVMLSWETSSSAVDEFVLTRLMKDSDASPDTLYRGTDYNYLDRSASPNQHYDYTIIARYSCQGKYSENASTTEGWRTPYGEISGTILMPDNTGMAGVEVALQSNEQTIRTITTDASGYFRFDSLEYEPYVCEKAEVKFTFGYNFSINNPSGYTMYRFEDPDGNVIEDWGTKAANSKHYYPVGTVVMAKTTMEVCRTNIISSFRITKNCIIDAYYERSARSPYLYMCHFDQTNTTDVTCATHMSTTYTVVPTSQYGSFSYNYTDAHTATITLSEQSAVATGLDFVNTSTTRLTGRVLYKNTTIPVSGAMFLLNGDTVRRGNVPLASGIDGNFELVLPLHQPCRLQVFKPGHTFEGEGILRVENNHEVFALTKALDGVRFYDQTTVRLVGRVAGGNDQRDLPEAFGLGKNNLGDDLQLIMQLEGDNTAQLVHDPNDLSRDTIEQHIDHILYSTDPLSAIRERSVGTTHALIEKKRIIIHPDPITGEYQVDLFPVKYKVTQATARGYATLFAAGQGSETFDLTNAPLDTFDPVRGTDSVHYNAVYDRIYHTPVTVSLTQILYGLERDGLGEEEIEASGMNPLKTEKVKLYQKQPDGSVDYLLEYPVFIGGRKYQFQARAYEQYFYNNDRQSAMVDEVPQRGGAVTIHNGMFSSTNDTTYALDATGRNRHIWLNIDQIDTENSRENALRTVSAVLVTEGNYVETTTFRAYVTGTNIQDGDLMPTESGVVLLDIVRDPGGNGSSAWVESGSTYNFSFTESYDWEIGIELGLNWGVSITQDIGAVAAPSGAGTYTGSTVESSRLLSIPIPISHEWKWGYKYNCSYTTTERIATSAGHAKDNVGANADVFVGTMVSQLAGKAKTVSLISDSLYQARQPAINAGVMKVLGDGTTAEGKHYYLVTGQKVVLGSRFDNTFAYTQAYILNTLIPKLANERMNLLMQFPDSAAAQAYANNKGEAVYWDISPTPTDPTAPLSNTAYRMIVPNDDKLYTNRIAAIDNMIREWVTILYANEREKVQARLFGKGRMVGTWSVSDGATFTHSDTYTATANYNELPQSGLLLGFETANNSTKMAQQLMQNAVNIAKFFKDAGNDRIGKTVGEIITKMQNEQGGGELDPTDEDEQQEMGTISNTSKFKFTYKPIFEFDRDINSSQERTARKASGFTLAADPHGDITVGVYRAEVDSVWKSESQFVRENTEQGNNDDLLYGSYVFYTMAGTSYCPHEAEDRTRFFNPGTVIANETQWVDKPELSINTHEQTAVMPDKNAVFRITLMNNGQVQTGVGANGVVFNLSLRADSNPNGAKVYVDGAPLINSIPVYLIPGQAVTKTMEVARGTVDDYNDLSLLLSLADCPKTNTSLEFSVHFLPVSSDVEIAMPRQNWIMNTLSAHDSIGYYLPMEIDGFDIHHKNFDHIEFQYKLSTQSEEAWVNQCSFFANDSLYNEATGNKAMIENGRIVPFRFYGERDPMEQRYDLRAVTFCRYGSGFVTKSSAVISGVKDTRPPQVFGDPEPANAILGVGDHLKLRFNEPIAGNYLDEDNNFQLIGVTNETDFTTDASIFFPGYDSYAESKVERSLADKSFSIDMMIKPANTQREHILFEHVDVINKRIITFGLDDKRKLFFHVGSYSLSNPMDVTINSKQLEELLEFTRVIMTYDHTTNQVCFYAGTLNVTDPNAASLPENFRYQGHSVIFLGSSYAGNLLETRIWAKALTAAEIAETANKRLSGYERELLAYYPMNEGRGTVLNDRANGATLFTAGTSWTLPKGISLSIKDGEQVELDNRYLSRSDIQDETFMLWFICSSDNGHLFSAGWNAGDSTHTCVGTMFEIVDGKLIFHSGKNEQQINATVVNNAWHHLVLTVNRTRNNASIFLDGKLTNSFPATQVGGISGAMYLGGNGYVGNVDELTIFEQALPKSFVEQYDNISPVGDEMGLMAYLPFEQQQLNANGILELVFSVNDQRQFRDKSTGEVVDKVVPLIVNQPATLQGMSDKISYAPVRNHGLLSKLYFDWAFNNDELLINIKNADKEINKQSLFVTVRDVEDLNGNPMPSPVMWTAFVDHNSLKWDDREVSWMVQDVDNNAPNELEVSFSNLSGKRHQYTVESVPQWLSVSPATGAIEPMGYKTLLFTFSNDVPVGVYSDIIYLVDENGLSEPLYVVYTVYANCPYQEPDPNAYPLNMSICGEVFVDDVYDTDPEDKIIALYRNECYGIANIDFNEERNTSKVHLSVFGDETMVRKELSFLLWQASTGKVFNLTTDRAILFAHGYVYGCGDGQAVRFATTGSQTQNIDVYSGWTWISTNLDLQADGASFNKVISAVAPWIEGDVIKDPTDCRFNTYAQMTDTFVGTIKTWNFRHMYMVYSANGNTLRLSGDKLPEDSMFISLRGDGQWNALPCLFSQVTPITEAMAGYYDNAQPGDIVKSHKHFAYFSEDKHWEGDLTALRPGEGYLMRRMGADTVTLHFYNQQNAAPAPRRQIEEKRTAGNELIAGAATNMTIIATIADGTMAHGTVRAYAGDQLVGIAEPIEVDGKQLYFLTIRSDKAGELRFTAADGTALRAVDPASSEVAQPITYAPDSHHGTIKAPVLLVMPYGNEWTDKPYKIIEDEHVYIIRNNEKYAITGEKL